MILKSIYVNAWQAPIGELRVIQEEANGRQIEVTVLGADGQPIDLTGNTVSVYLEKPDGTIIFDACTVSGTTVTITFTAQMMAVAGKCNLFELQIVGSGNQTLKVTLPTLWIVPSNYDGAVESSNEFSALSQALGTITNINLYTKIREYTSFEDLGLQNTATYEEIFNAMVSPSYAILMKATTTNQPETPISPTTSGLLIVEKLSGSRSSWRFIRGNDNGVQMYFGYYDNNISPKFTGWKEVITDSDIDTQLSGASENPVQNKVIANELDKISSRTPQFDVSINAMKINENDDLNDYTQIGTYYCFTTEIAGTLTNKPSSLTRSFLMYCGEITAPKYQYQLIIENFSGNQFIRVLKGTYWTEWKQIATSETGTWTPTFKGFTTAGSYTYGDTNEGYYFKVGNYVYIHACLAISKVNSAPVGSYIVTGLPFSTGGPWGTSAITVGLSNGGQNNAPRKITGGVVLDNEIRFKFMLNSIEQWELSDANCPLEVGDNFNLYFSGWYRIAE